MQSFTSNFAHFYCFYHSYRQVCTPDEEAMLQPQKQYDQGMWKQLFKLDFIRPIQSEMGSSYTKDDNIDIYAVTNKQFYVAGEYVEGEVYLNCKKDSKYSSICITIDGLEHVHWTTGSGKNRRSYNNSYQNYQAYIPLVDYHGTVQAGHYLFPFSFLLPAMMSGSFLFSQNCYIKYLLRVKLLHPTEEKDSQIYEMHLNILEPPRFPLGAITLTNNVNSKCCGCCSDYGHTVASLSCNKNFVVNGDQVQVQGAVNNTLGKENITSFKVVLEEKRIMISSGGATRNSIDNSYAFLVNEQGVPAGQSREFSFTGTIPQQIVNYTAIGRITARYFVLHLYTQYGCCANTAEAILHLVVHSRTPMIVEKKQIPMPSGWYPKVYPKVTCNTLKPFNLSPLPSIPFQNMPGSQNVVISMNPQSHEYPSMANQYQQPSPDFIPQIMEGLTYNYQPTYYNQDLFTDAEKQQQGYTGHQPYFANQNSQQAFK